MVVEVKAISKSFPGVRSLDRVDFSVSSGEVRALVGENGAGKSTLIKIIAGAYTPDEGELLFDGANVKWSSPHEAQAAGIHVIYQELVLFPEMTVAQNIFVNRQPRNSLRMIDYRAMKARAKALLGELGAPIDVGEKIKRLSVADRQMVEIARALNSDAKLIVFDEPTAVLGGHEVDLLFAIVRRLKQRGVAIVFISHRLDEVFEIADSVTVLKDGTLVGSMPIDAIDRNKLVAMMIGRNLADIYPPKAQKGEVGEVAVEAKDVFVGDRVKGVSFEARKGEVLGVAGMVGAGRTELAHAVFGSLPLDGGSVRLVGQAVAKPSPARSIAAGLGFLTEDRKGEGLFMLLDLAANVTAPVLDKVGASNSARPGSREGHRPETDPRLFYRSDRARSIGRQSFRREPAEGASGPLGHFLADRSYPRRADPWGRRRGKGRDLPDHSSACASGSCDHHNKLGAAGNRRPVRSGRGSL